jgi:hypothetical protein
MQVTSRKAMLKLWVRLLQILREGNHEMQGGRQYQQLKSGAGKKELGERDDLSLLSRPFSRRPMEWYGSRSRCSSASAAFWCSAQGREGERGFWRGRDETRGGVRWGTHGEGDVAWDHDTWRRKTETRQITEGRK